MNNNKIELLSPAGSIESFKAACQNGADAVYMGVDKYNARAIAVNFGINEYIECIEYAHIRGIKVYLTLNTLMYDDEIKEALDIVLKLYSKGLDAVIIQDIGLGMLIHKLIPKLPLHASTQMSVYSLDQVKYLEGIGFKRVVLARELSVDEIEYICKNTNLEIEVFIHGALCVSVSGQCLLSSTIGNRSANRGRCAQPCRMKYSLYNSKGKELISNSYILSKKDIFGLEYVNKLKEIGVTSLKIEGRNKNPEYVAGVTKNYRNAINNNINSNTKQELMQLFNRGGISIGYFDGVKYKNSISLLSPKNTGIFLGKVIDKKGVYVKLKLEEDIDMHDGFEIYSEDKVISNIVTCIKNDKYVNVNSNMKKGEYVWIGDVKKSVKIGSNIYKTSSDKLNKKYRLTYSNNVENIKNKVEVEINILKDKKIFAKVFLNNICINIDIDYIPQLANNKELDKEAVISAFSKTQDIPFIFDFKKINIDNKLFVPVSILNELRRKIVYEILKSYKININVSNEEKLVEKLLNEEVVQNIKIKDSNKVNAKFLYKYDNKVNYAKVDRLYIDICDYIKYREDILEKYKNVQIYIVIPNVVLSNKRKIILDNIDEIFKDNISGVLLGSFEFFKLVLEKKKQYNFSLVADYTLNISNIYSATFLVKEGFDVITPSYDMSITDIENMSRYVNVEIVEDYITVMTSRYCILGSMLEDRKENKNCSMPCLKDRFYLKDDYGYKYYIINDSIDCIMRLVKQIRNINLDSYNIRNITSIRKSII